MENNRGKNILQRGKSKSLILWLFVLLCIASLPLIFRLTHFADYLMYITVRIMILGIFAMSYDIVFGYTGIINFGHAMFIGSGAYTVGILMKRITIDFHDSSFAILIALAVGIILGWIVGFLCSKVGRVAVFIVTFGFAEALHLFVLSDPFKITNAEDGIAGISREPLLTFLNIKPEIYFYYFTFILLCISYLALRIIIRSPFGDVLMGIRDNPLRVRFLGYQVQHYRIASFMIAGFFASLAGALTAFHEGSTSPELFHWFFSGDAVIFTVLGGPGTLLGPVMGAAIVVILQEVLSDIFHNWVIFLGIGYIALIMFLPKGLFPLLQRLRVRQ